MPRKLANLEIDEVSAVDRGAGEGVRVLLMKRHSFSKRWQDFYKSEGDEWQLGLSDSAFQYLKREFSADERQSAASSGAALPDGSFPIKNKQDLENAIHAIGRAKDPAKAKAHIKTRAAALGATDLLPDEWSKRDDKAEKALKLCIASILDSDGIDKRDALAELFKQFDSYTQEQDAMTITVDKNELTNVIKSVVQGLLAEAGLILKMSDEHQAYHNKLSGAKQKAFAAMEPAERDTHMEAHPIGKDAGDEHGGDAEDEEGRAGKKKKEKHEKACKALSDATGLTVAACDVILKAAKHKVAGDHDDGAEHGDDQEEATENDTETGRAKHKTDKRIDAELAKRDTTISALTKKLAVLEVDKQKVTFGKRAVELGMAEEQGEILRKAHMGDPEALKKLEEVIAGLHKQVETGEVFKEFGGHGGTTGNTAHEQLVAKATEIRKADTTGKLTQEQAYVKAMEANPELVKRESDERHARINGKG